MQHNNKKHMSTHIIFASDKYETYNKEHNNDIYNNRIMIIYNTRTKYFIQIPNILNTK